MKEMSKTKIIDKKSINSIKSELYFLSKINHPFIVNMHFAFQDNTNLYLVTDLLTGGDLRYQLYKNKAFNEETSKYFISCILLGLEYLHSNRIIHRDLKPENLVLDNKGKIKITDFGIARLEQMNNIKDISGTPGYTSPEVMCGLKHSITVDYFALGVIAYEFMFGKRPYEGNSRKEIKEKIMAKQVRIKFNECPKDWSFYAVDFINKLLIRKPKKRLGYNGFKEIKEHPWFKKYNWKELYMGKLNSPFIPKNEDNYDKKYCLSVDLVKMKTKERYEKIVSSEEFKSAFVDYYFNRNLRENLGNGINDLIKFKNPHLIYEIEYDMEMEKKSKINRLDEFGFNVNDDHLIFNNNNSDNIISKLKRNKTEIITKKDKSELFNKKSFNFESKFNIDNCLNNKIYINDKKNNNYYTHNRKNTNNNIMTNKLDILISYYQKNKFIQRNISNDSTKNNTNK